MGETLPSVPSLRHGRDLNESRAGTSGRSNSLYSVLPQHLTLLAVPPGCESCVSSQSIPRLLLLCCLISLVLLGLQFLVNAELTITKPASPWFFCVTRTTCKVCVSDGSDVCRMAKLWRRCCCGLTRSH